MPACRHFSRSPNQGVAGHGDDARALVCRPALANLPRGFQAVHLRHLHVEEEDVVGLLFERLEDFDAVAGDVGAIAQLVQDAEADFLVDGIVVGQEQAQGQAAGEVGVERRRGRRFLLALDLDAHGAAEGVEQLRRADGLVDEHRRRWRAAGAPVVTARADGGKQRAAARSGRKAACGFPRPARTVLVRQLQIEDDGIEEIALRKQRQGVAAVRRRFPRSCPIAGRAG